MDVLTGENAVNVGDSRADLPARLGREQASEPFTGEGRMLSGTGAVVRYSAPDRFEQACRTAAA